MIELLKDKHAVIALMINQQNDPVEIVASEMSSTIWRNQSLKSFANIPWMGIVKGGVGIQRREGHWTCGNIANDSLYAIMAYGFWSLVWWNSSVLLLNRFGPALPGRFTKGAILKWRLHNFRDFGPPPPLVYILARSISLNPRNLPHYVCILLTPLPISVDVI